MSLSEIHSSHRERPPRETNLYVQQQDNEYLYKYIFKKKKENKTGGIYWPPPILCDDKHHVLVL